MIRCQLVLFYFTLAHAAHFNGGTIRWQPVNPYDNSSSVTITIIQSYWWTYPTITCATNVPISTSGRTTQGSNLTCVADCGSDGGYSSAPVRTLTDCVSVSSALGMMTSERSQNITLTAGAHFYLAYVGSAWLPLGSPTKANLQWSITSSIDLRMRADGYMNTPPVVNIISPQYIIVNRTAQIRIPVSDANLGDDIRCRWSTYTNGFRRRREMNEDLHKGSTVVKGKTSITNEDNILNRKKRALRCSSKCTTQCRYLCDCACPVCLGTTCTGSLCRIMSDCLIATTTIDTPKTLLSTSTYPARQSIDECGGICHPNALPSNTTLSNCTLSIKGLVTGTWYAAAIQMEDFINTSSNIPMSSVPVQFLIYVMPEPQCTIPPLILPLTGCLEVAVGVSMSFNLSILNYCNTSIADINDVVQSEVITGMQRGNLTTSSTNSSLTYLTFSWTPHTNQIGPQQMCAIAYTEEQVQSAEYCVIFNVMPSLPVCVTTTTTSTSTTTTSSSTSSTSTSTSTTTTSSSTSSTSASTATTTTAITTATTSTSTTTAPTTTSTSPPATTQNITVAAIATNNEGRGPSWGLIAGIASISLPLCLCTGCCLYRLVWSPAARRRRQVQDTIDEWRYSHLSSRSEITVRTSSDMNDGVRITNSSQSYQAHKISPEARGVNRMDSFKESEPSILMSIFNNTNAKFTNTMSTPKRTQSLEMRSVSMQPQTHGEVPTNMDDVRHRALRSIPLKSISDLNENRESPTVNRLPSGQEELRAFSTSPDQTDRCSSLHTSLSSTAGVGQSHNSGGEMFNFTKLARKYTFGSGQKT